MNVGYVHVRVQMAMCIDCICMAIFSLRFYTMGSWHVIFMQINFNYANNDLLRR